MELNQGFGRIILTDTITYEISVSASAFLNKIESIADFGKYSLKMVIT
jgi:hypothetical protein